MPIFIQSIEPSDELRETPILVLGLQYVIELYNIYPFNTPVFPGIELYKGELEAVLNTDLPEQATMTIEASIFTEDTVTQEKIVIDASRNTATTRKATLEVRDYLGNILLQGTAEN
jgi:hypothetical protein